MTSLTASMKLRTSRRQEHTLRLLPILYAREGERKTSDAEWQTSR